MRARLRPILIATLLVLTGGVLALLLERIIVQHAAGSTAAAHDSVVAHMDSTLRLTRAQRDSIHAIFAHHQSTVDSAWRSINHRMHATIDSVHRQMEQVLEPDQRRAFHEWMRRQHAARGVRH